MRSHTHACAESSMQQASCKIARRAGVKKESRAGRVSSLILLNLSFINYIYVALVIAAQDQVGQSPNASPWPVESEGFLVALEKALMTTRWRHQLLAMVMV